MAADSSAVFAEALIGRDDGTTAEPGAWYPEEVLTLDRLINPLAAAGITVQAAEDGRTIT